MGPTVLALMIQHSFTKTNPIKIANGLDSTRKNFVQRSGMEWNFAPFVLLRAIPVQRRQRGITAAMTTTTRTTTTMIVPSHRQESMVPLVNYEDRHNSKYFVLSAYDTGSVITAVEEN